MLSIHLPPPRKLHGKVWIENLATALGLVVTPAEVGFAGTSVKCPSTCGCATA